MTAVFLSGSDSYIVWVIKTRPSIFACNIQKITFLGVTVRKINPPGIGAFVVIRAEGGLRFREEPDGCLILLYTIASFIIDLIQTSQIAVVSEISQLYSTSDLVFTDFSHILHIRHVLVMSH